MLNFFDFLRSNGKIELKEKLEGAKGVAVDQRKLRRARVRKKENIKAAGREIKFLIILFGRNFKNSCPVTLKNLDQ